MSTEDLETFLETGIETQRVDFKSSCPWDVSMFAKDILAMTNVQEGGLIIIGVAEEKDGRFKRVGLLKKHRETYKIDMIKDQMGSFADPHINISLEFPHDLKGLEYAVITVEPFKEIPVLCARDGKDVRAGGIYYRNRDKKVESALVSNSYDMRDILDRAVVKLSQRAKTIGFPLPEHKADTSIRRILEERLKKELGDL